MATLQRRNVDKRPTRTHKLVNFPFVFEIISQERIGPTVAIYGVTVKYTICVQGNGADLAASEFRRSAIYIQSISCKLI